MNELVKRYNDAVDKLNNLEVDRKGLFKRIGDNAPITVSEVEYLENHYLIIDKLYKDLKIGKHAK